MTIVRHKDKKSGRVYLYESTPYYDPVTKQQRPKRKYLGMADPVTGKLIPSAGKRGRKPGTKVTRTPAAVVAQQNVVKLKEVSARLNATEKELRECRQERDRLRKSLEASNKALMQIAQIVAAVRGDGV